MTARLVFSTNFTHATRRRQVAAAAGSSAEPRVLVTGATGGTGKALVDRLTSEGIHVAAMSRSAAKASASLPSAVTTVECDLFDYDSVRKAVAGKETIFICSGTTARADPFDPLKVDWQGVENLVAAAKQSGTVGKIVMVSSIGVDDPFFPLNVIGGVLWMKKLGELAVQRSGIDYTIIRPGGLRSTEMDDGMTRNAVVVGRPNTFGLPPRPKLPGGIRRQTVAQACVEAMRLPEAQNKVVEMVEEEGAPLKTWAQLFSEI